MVRRKSRERQAELRIGLYDTPGEREFWKFIGQLL
jgi:hypothetical protein